MPLASVLKDSIRSFFEYETPHIVHIQSYKVGVLARFVQLCIIAYIAGYVITYKKGYQLFSEVNSAVTTKLKGVAYPNFTDDQFKIPNPGPYRNRVWDVADYVVPPQENGAFFVMTNVIITSNQTQGICPEDPRFSTCTSNHDCELGYPVKNGNGFMTGNCVPSADTPSIRTCEIKAWCPVENDDLPLGNTSALLIESYNFTVLIKNSIEFPLFEVKRRNIRNTSNATYLLDCHYNAQTDQSCPVFKLGAIVEEAGENYTQMAIQGGVMAIIINWDCNLDFNPDRHCIPTYRFRRLDDPNAKIAKGWNFRYASYYNDNSRSLYKAYGIRFVILVEGRGGKFNIVPLLLNVGSGLALLGIATVICDFVILYMTKYRHYYQEKKFIIVDREEIQKLLASNRNIGENSGLYTPLDGN